MKTYHFKSTQSVPVSFGQPNNVSSLLTVNYTGGLIEDINVKIDIEHTYTNDLEIRLKAPSGSSIILVRQQGGREDNFNETVFDDAALISINTGQVPFRNIYKPTEALSLFKGLNANGTWTLEVADIAPQDGGRIKEWSLEIITDEMNTNTGPFIFNNRTIKLIPSTGNNIIESKIDVIGLGSVVIDSICLTLDIDHSYTSDLKISLIGPDDTNVLLIDRVGNSGDNFSETTLDDSATLEIEDGTSPFTGRFKPSGQLSDFQNKVANGIWTLRISDEADLDGGLLKSWSLSIKSTSTPVPERPYEIKVRFMGGLTASQEAIFKIAADRWSEVIVGNLPPYSTDIGRVDDIVIDASGIQIDGQLGTLGRAGPTAYRPDNLLPVRGIMEFDKADLQRMEDEGELVDVIIHEMGHCLGIGTMWGLVGLIRGSGSNNPEFTGANAMAEYATLKNLATPQFVPIANTGGQGTAGGHWRESVFDTELMTGYDDPGRNALSRLTIASLQDMGYQVNYSKADAYILPFALLSLSSVDAKQEHQCTIITPDYIILPEENKIT